MIVASGVRQVFGDDARAAVDGIDLTVAGGEFVAIMGPSGSGKSTLIQLLAGLDAPSAGRISIGDRRITEMTEDELARFRRDRVGFVFQSFHLIPTMSVLENVAASALVGGVRRRSWEPRAVDLLTSLGLSDLVTRPITGLSGGEQQRIAVCRAVFNRPDVVFADEPTGSLDSTNGAAVLRLLRDATTRHDASGSTVMVTHDPRSAAVADRVIHMRDGALVAQLDLVGTEVSAREERVRAWMGGAAG